MKRNSRRNIRQKLSFSFGCVALLAAFALLSGCAMDPVGISGFAAGQEQEDIPVPTSFVFQRSETYDPAIPEEARFRSWKGIYRGHMRLGTLAPWYVTQMKKHGWEFHRKDEAADGKTKTMRFLKGDEEAVIKLLRRFDRELEGHGSFIEASVHPRGPESFAVDELIQLRDRGLEKSPSATESIDRGLQPASLPSDLGLEETEIDGEGR